MIKKMNWDLKNEMSEWEVEIHKGNRHDKKS